MLRPLSFVVKLPVLLTLYLNANTALAQVYNSSISAATGGTGRATVEIGDVSFLNPATLVHLKGRSFFASGATDEFAVALSDNTNESSFPGTLSYVQKQKDIVEGKSETRYLNFSVAEFAVDKFAMGLTARYTEARIDEGNSYFQLNGDLGFIYTPEPHIGVALVISDLAGTKTDLPKELQTKLKAAAGFNYIHRSTFRARLDATSESELMVGLETYLNRYIITRIGHFSDLDDNHQLWTAGIGFNGPKFALNYAYEGNPQNSDDYRHSVDLAVPF